MDYISGKNQEQYYMGCLEDSIEENNPVRFVDAYVSQLNTGALGFQNSAPQETGQPAYSSKDLLKRKHRCH